MLNSNEVYIYSFFRSINTNERRIRKLFSYYYPQDKILIWNMRLSLYSQGHGLKLAL